MKTNEKKSLKETIKLFKKFQVMSFKQQNEFIKILEKKLKKEEEQ